MREPARASARGYLVHAMALAGAALAAAALPVAPWVPLHLAFTGAATLGLFGATTFFLATLRAAPEPPAALRRAHIAAHEASVALLIAGRASGRTALMVAGGTGYIASVAWVAGVLAWQTLRSRRWAGQAASSLAAVACLGAGSVLGLLLAAGRIDATRAYPAHVTLNLLGALGILAAGTAPRFVPMMVRVRIREGAVVEAPWIVLACGVTATAAGYVTGTPSLAGAGQFLAFAGASGSAASVVHDIARSKLRREPDAGHVAAASVWYATAWLVLLVSDTTAVSRLVGPVAAGFVVQLFLGAWSYLVPALQRGGSSGRRYARDWIAGTFPLRAALLNAGALVLLVWPARGTGWWLVAAAVATFGASAFRAVRGHPAVA